jgi:hypothetical protein
MNKAIIPSSMGCTTLVKLGGKKTIVILLNCKVEKPNDSQLPTCLKGMSSIVVHNVH